MSSSDMAENNLKLSQTIQTNESTYTQRSQ